jgi:hypothetical protein
MSCNYSVTPRTCATTTPLVPRGCCDGDTGPGPGPGDGGDDNPGTIDPGQGGLPEDESPPTDSGNPQPEVRPREQRRRAVAKFFVPPIPNWRNRFRWQARGGSGAINPGVGGGGGNQTGDGSISGGGQPPWVGDDRFGRDDVPN